MREHDPKQGLVLEKSYVSPSLPNGVSFSRGDEVAFFHMGSTVVLVFEAPPMVFDVQPGQHVKMGASLAHFVQQPTAKDTLEPTIKV